jgi:5-(carboxyamino)imidazole ribonucleotide synthase
VNPDYRFIQLFRQTMTSNAPSTTIGILGSGQLGRMLALAGYPLGYRFRFLDTSADAPSGRLAPIVEGDLSDLALLHHFAEGLTVATYEFENVPVESARALNELVAVFPPPAALEVSQDRLIEKSYFVRHNIPTTLFVRVDTREGLDLGIAQIGFPCVLKTRRMGYDGKGQVVLRAANQVNAAWLAMQGSALILEQYVPFDMEVSLLSVRSTKSELAFYPLVKNVHREGILRQSVPVDPSQDAGRFNILQQIAQQYATRVLNDLNYVGVLTIEFFVVAGALLANEMAPRVHNSGHWTIEGAETSQFENHIRAITSLPLGSTALKGYSAMLNIIGELPDVRAVMSVPNAHMHLYDKMLRPGRKIGHVTINAPDATSRDDSLYKIGNLLLVK